MLRVVIYYFISVALTSCASSSLRVSSNPEGADVTVIARDRAPIKVGKTPIELNAQNTPELFSDSLQIQISREGHSPLSVLVPKLALGATGRVNANLQETMLPKECLAQTDSLSEVARGIAEASGLIQRKRLDEASLVLQGLASKFGSVSVLHDLLGNVYFLKKDLSRALDSYEKSNLLSPNNPQTVRMINRIQELQGKRPVGG